MARLAHVAVVAFLAVLVIAETASALTCSDVTSSIGQCMSYATGKAKAPSAECCSGVRTLNGKAKSTADRRTACSCLKNLAGTFKSLNMGNAASIPSKCGVNVGIPISTNVDCSKVS